MLTIATQVVCLVRVVRHVLIAFSFASCQAASTYISKSLKRTPLTSASSFFKCYKSIEVVDGVTLYTYRSEITLLLGFGENTIMNLILDKLFSYESRACISSKSTGHQQSIGVCPQSSVLDNAFNVLQHLILFADITSSAISKVACEILIRQTINHEQKPFSELSGGMQSKLSSVLTFAGKSSILILNKLWT